MKCIMCKVCEAAHAAVEKKLAAWLNAQMNTEEMWEREPDQSRAVRAYELLSTDPVEAFKECLTLAEQGSIWAMGSVGWAFSRGNGTPRDLAQAEKWYRRAFDGGSDYALLGLGHVYMQQREYTKAEEVFRTGADRSWAPAMYRLAWTYSKSAAWRQKRDEARVLLERASAAGDLSAGSFLATAMMRGWFGWRRIPSGIRMNFKLADDLYELVKDDETLAVGSKGDKPVGLISRLIRRLSLGVIGMPATPAHAD
jgi:TPR repeat protein